MSEPDDDGYQPRPLMGRSFWIMMAISIICVIAGAAVAWLLPALLG
jgi:flagellar basal body-associated protein FliL